MKWEDVKPMVLMVAVVVSGVVSAMGGIHQERGRSKKALEVQSVRQEAHCESLLTAVLADERGQRMVIADRLDSLMRSNEIRDAVRVRSRASASSSAVIHHDCNCGASHRSVEKRPSFLSRWAPPLVGLAAGIAIGHSWAPRAVETVVNVMGDGGGGDDERDHMHQHGHRWYHGKKHKKHDGHDEHGRKDD